MGHWTIDPTILGLYIRTYEDSIPSRKGSSVEEKAVATNGEHETVSGANGGGAEAGEGAPTASAPNVA